MVDSWKKTQLRCKIEASRSVVERLMIPAAKHFILTRDFCLHKSFSEAERKEAIFEIQDEKFIAI